MGMTFLGSRRSLLHLLLFASWGCSDPSDDPNEIHATVVHEAWVFFHANENHDDARHEGAATIDDNDCLLIGDAVVVWFEDDVPEVSRIVEEVRAGSSPLVVVGGGEATNTNTNEEIVSRCPGATVWYGAPLGSSPEQ